jgi:oxazoline/thiazoline synthase
MIRRPRFQPHLTPVVLPGEGVLLLSAAGQRVLHGEVFERLAPLLDGTRDVDALVAALAEGCAAARVYYALLLLEKNGHLCEALPGLAEARAAFWSTQGVDPVQARDALARRRVAILGIGEADAAPLHAALSRAGIAVDTAAGAAESVALTVVLTDDYQRPQLVELAARWRQAARPWLLARPTGHALWLGPLYRPATAGCQQCLIKRLARHTRAKHLAADRLGNDRLRIDPPVTLPTGPQLFAELIALEVVRYLAGVPIATAGAVLTLDSRTLTTETHRLIPVPWCRLCGETPVPAARPLLLQPCKAQVMDDGGHRHVAPEETLARHQHLVSPITGLVKELVAVRDDPPVRVYVAGRNTALRVERLADFRRGLRQMSAGKGVSAVQAKTSALCEALERYSGELQGDEVVVTASYRAMRDRHGDSVIHPNAVMRYSDLQYAGRKALNARQSRFNVVPEPLDETLPIDWTPVWSLSASCQVYLPTQLLYYGAPATAGVTRRFAIGCSNGCALGNTLEEAVLQGLFELVERDATALWWYPRLRRPGFDLAHVDDRWVRDVVAWYAQRGRDCWALDLTSDLGIPVVAALSRLRAGGQERIIFGLGCHLDAPIALQRAFAEMNQMLGVAEARIEHADLDDRETRHWLATATLANQPYLAPDPDQPPRRLAEFPVRHSGELLTDLTTCRHLIEARGLQLLVLDQTRRDVGLPVVKVLVPGLRHFWARYGTGRLYEVPVAMGWLAAEPDEAALNPIPIFI